MFSINFPDPKLKYHLAEALNKDVDADITKGDLTSITTLDLSGFDISPLTDLKDLKTLKLNSNTIKDISPITNLTKLTTLHIINNEITDISPLNSFKDGIENGSIELYAWWQNITLPSSLGVSSFTIPVTVKDLHGRVIKNIQCEDGIYDENTNSITWNNITKDTEVSYSFESKEINNFVFSGTVTTTLLNDNITSEVDIPDKNLKASILQNLDKPNESYISKSDLESLTSLWSSCDDIENLTGLEYCKNLKRINLGGCRINNIEPLSNLTKLT